MNNLTALKVKNAKIGWHADGGGLYLRVRDGDRRSFVFRAVKDGKLTEIGLGSEISLAAARQRAAELRDQIAMGKDPKAEKAAKAAAQARRKAFSEAAAFVIKRDRKSWGASSLAAWERSLNVDAKQLHALDVAEIAVEDVKQTVMPIFDRGEHVAARMTLSRIAAVLECAIAHGWRSAANVADWRTFHHIAPKREKLDRRHPMVPWREAPAAFAELRANDTMAARCLELVALTGVRLSEAREATWSEFDLDLATWTIPARRMKMRVEHVVPLSSAAIELLKGLHEVRSSMLVFPGKTGNPVSRNAAWETNVEATGKVGSPHGWRATFRTWAGDHGVVKEVAESALAHKVGGVEGAYNRAAMVEMRKPVMENWAAFLSGKTTATVIPFTGPQR